MKLMRQFPKGFFRVSSPIANPTNNPDDEIISVKWNKKSNNKKR